MTNLNDNTAHDFSMYYPKGQNGNILNTNSKSKKKKVLVASVDATKNRRVMRLESLEVSLSFSFPVFWYCSPERKRTPRIPA